MTDSMYNPQPPKSFIGKLYQELIQLRIVAEIDGNWARVDAFNDAISVLVEHQVAFVQGREPQSLSVRLAAHKAEASDAIQH